MLAKKHLGVFELLLSPISNESANNLGIIKSSLLLIDESINFVWHVLDLQLLASLGKHVQDSLVVLNKVSSQNINVIQGEFLFDILLEEEASAELSRAIINLVFSFEVEEFLVVLWSHLVVEGVVRELYA